MKVLPFNISKPLTTAILYQLDTGVFYNQLHQHEEVQISWIEQGEGTLFAGDTIHRYKAGDLIVLGGQQPHVFRSANGAGAMHTVFFNLTAFGDTFLQLDEGSGIKAFYAFAKAGLKTTTSLEIQKLILNISKAIGIVKLQHFLNLITCILNKQTTPLSNFIYNRTLSEADGKRMNAIFDYTMAHYTRAISLDGVAIVATMTPHAFCKYFKKRTNKTYFEFVNELRINKACNILRSQPEKPIRVIADLCGFQTLSHFNKKFRYLMGMVPSAYRTYESLSNR